MMNLVSATLIPIAIIVALPFLVFFFKKKYKYFSVKMTHWLLLVYGGILVGAFVVIAFMDKEEPSHLSEKEQQGVNFYAAIENGDILKYKDDYLIQEMEYEFEGEILTLKAYKYHDGQSSLIFIEKKQEEDRQVEAYLFGTPPHIEGIDLSDKVIFPHFRFEGDALSVTYPEFQDIQMAMAKKEFVVNQFTGESWMTRGFQYEDPILFLRIPGNVEINEDPNLNYQYLE